MNRWWLVVCLTIGQSAMCGCGGDEKKKPNVAAEGKEERKRTKKESDLEKAITSKLTTKPASVEVAFSPLDVGPDPVDIVRVNIKYDKENSLGYEGFRVEGLYHIWNNRPPTTSMMAIHSQGGEEMKLLTISFDDEGKEAHSLPFEKDKEQLAAVKKKCVEIKDALRKALPKKPAPRK